MPKRTKAVTTRKLFPRRPRAPLAVQDRASLWLDLFVDFATGLAATREGMSPTVTIELAEELADRSLDSFEKRWPTAEVPGRD